MVDPCDECYLKAVGDGVLRHIPEPVVRHLLITVVLSLLGIAFVAGTIIWVQRQEISQSRSM